MNCRLFALFFFFALFALVRADEDMEMESPEPTPEDEPACFPGNSKVTTLAGVKRIDELAIGDRVLSAPGVYSEVVMFTHSDAEFKGSFVELVTSTTKLHLSHGHYIYANGNLIAAKDVKTGDLLTLADGSVDPVTSVKEAVNAGLFNPQTAHGDIVVDGVVASTYTTFIQPSAAHTLLAPVRAFFALAGNTVSASA